MKSGWQLARLCAYRQCNASLANVLLHTRTHTGRARSYLGAAAPHLGATRVILHTLRLYCQIYCADFIFYLFIHGRVCVRCCCSRGVQTTWRLMALVEPTWLEERK